jgi:DNA-binding LacI/PurR family transcriptional regulator
MARPNLLSATLEQEFRNRILNGYAPGERIPALRTWASTYGIAASTANRILRKLAHEGLVCIQSRTECRRTDVPYWTARQPATPRSNGLRLGIFSRYTRPEWESWPLYREILRIADDRKVELIEMPHRYQSRSTPGRKRVDFINAPWNKFDVGILVELEGHTPFASLAQQRRPVISLDTDATYFGIPSVTYDNFKAGYMIGELFLKLGHRRLAVLDECNEPGWPNDSAWTACRHGFEMAATHGGGCIRSAWRLEVTRTRVPGIARRPGLAEVQKWQSVEPQERPTALFSIHLPSLIVGMETIINAGFSVPSDLSLASVTDTVQSRESAKIAHARFDLTALVQRAFDAAADIATGANNVASKSLFSLRGEPTKLYVIPPTIYRGDTVSEPPPREKNVLRQ